MTNWINQHAELLAEDYGKESVSASLRQGLGQYALASEEASVGASDNRAALELAQRKLARSVNVLSNNDQGSERSLSIGWSDGSKANNPKDDTIWLSPDDVLKAGEKGGDRAIDALTGQSLLASTMKRTISKSAWNSAQADTSPTAAASRIIWQAIETAVARNEVLDSWEGFAPYFARHEQANCAHKKHVQKVLDESAPTLELAATALAWNILHPHDPLKLPKPYERGVNAALDHISKGVPTSPKRYKESQALCSLLEIDPPDLPPPPPGGGTPPPGGSNPKPKNEDDGGSSGGAGGGEDKDDSSKDKKGESDKSDKSDEKKDKGGKGDEKKEKDSDGKGELDKPDEPGKSDGKPDKPAPKVSDESLFGGKVDKKSKISEGDIPKELECSKLSTEDQNFTPPSGVGKCTGASIDFIEDTDPTDYNNATARLSTYIKAITESLRFRNNDPTLHIRGVHSGDLDEGSLDKLALNETHPAIWERRELHGQPRVAVGILIDESGSMGGTKIRAAKDVVIALSAALSKIKGVSLMVLGHTSNCDRKKTILPSGASGYSISDLERYIKDSKTKAEEFKRRKEDSRAEEYEHYANQYTEMLMLAKKFKFGAGGSVKITESTQGTGRKELLMSEYLTIKHRNPYALTLPVAVSGNLDGWAMDYAVRKMIADYPTHERRTLFVVSDGQPSGTADSGHYGGDSAMIHMRSVCEFGRRNQVGVYGIGICNAYSNTEGDAMYGHGNYVIIKDVLSSLPILTAALRNIANRPL